MIGDRRLKIKELKISKLLLSNQASRQRHKDWLQARKKREESNGVVTYIGTDAVVGSKRKRAANRSKEVIAEEKRL